MVNLLGYEHSEGDYATQLSQLEALPQSHVHWYGKGKSRPGRKLGHVTILQPPSTPADPTWAKTTVEQVEKLWYPAPCQ
jgi:5-(carboxyamino)imidazole ribonucleotide synthase